MANVQPEHGTAPIAYELLEALYKDNARALADRIILWVLRNTYGRRHHKTKERRKTCSFTWRVIAKEIEADASDVGRAGRSLLASNRLLLDARGHIGIQKNPEKWLPWNPVRIRKGRKPLAKSPEQKAPTQKGLSPLPRRGFLHHSPNARAVLSGESEPGSPSRAPAPSLPNGLPDTSRNRVELASWTHPPDAASDYARLNFDKQREHDQEWEANCKRADSDRRAQYLAEEVKKQR